MDYEAITLNATQAHQFGKVSYASCIRFGALKRFLEAFKEVQRNEDPDQSKSICKYILNSLFDGEFAVIPPIIATYRGQLEFDKTKGQINFDIQSKLSINDGQHRVSGIKMAIKKLREDVEKATGEKKTYLEKKLDELENMRVQICIQTNLSIEEEQKLFHDINILGKRPSKSTALKFKKEDLYTALAMDLAQENKYLNTYGVNFDTHILKTNEYFTTLNVLRDSICYIITGSCNGTKETLTEENYESWKSTIDEVFNELFLALPGDCKSRDKYIIALATPFRSIGRYLHYLLNHNEISDWKSYVKGLRNIDWRHSSFWNARGGIYDITRDRVTFLTNTKGVFQTLVKYNQPEKPKTAVE
ncbi:DNA sulfur modification protein DndB [Salinithrix halophila]|uniref:DNA sulfur modification protein DndB n=1 Tax=Salinithrix halophila TaxID=1485204 RepID=A0ABV8JA60_9BACL